MDEKTKKEVVKAYQSSRNSIQDLARIYRVDVYQVLDAIGEGRLSKVRLEGDMIDENEAGPGAQMSYGKDVRVPIDPN